MNTSTPTYLGKVVTDLSHFRVFIFDAHGNKKLVGSWHDYCEHMETGLWFDTQEAADLAQQEAQKALAEPIVTKVQTRKKNQAVDESVLPIKD